MTFGEKLKQTRLALDLSQSDLAKKTGISERSLYTYEQTGTMPRTSNIKKLADALGVSVAYLVSDGECENAMDTTSAEPIERIKEKYGSAYAKEVGEIFERTSALFAGGELDEESKELFFNSLMEVYLESKAEASEKFSGRRRAKRKTATSDK